jgi:hypothetical protein
MEAGVKLKGCAEPAKMRQNRNIEREWNCSIPNTVSAYETLHRGVRKALKCPICVRTHLASGLLITIARKFV